MYRCFTFGIGSGASTALVEGLARAGNGTAEFVKEGERLQPKVIIRLIFYNVTQANPSFLNITLEKREGLVSKITCTESNIP